MSTETTLAWWRRLGRIEIGGRAEAWGRNGVPQTRVHVEMPPVMPPAPERLSAETFARVQDANVFNETKPGYAGRPPKPAPKPAPGPAAAYVALYPALVRVAREHGYALAVHGSVQRDFDLVAAPWTPEATDALTLINALKAHLGAVTWGQKIDHHYPDCAPTTKPHGRTVFCLHFTEGGGQGPYLDVSVMPRVGSNLPSDESMMT